MEPTLIESKIYEIRGQRVMLDKDLADLYAVETKNLNKAVKRNPDRFPPDFMFQLTEEEFKHLRFHFGTSSWGGSRYMPYAFTEQGVAMLSGILRSPIAVQVNINIMRAFVSIRQYVLASEAKNEEIEELKQRIQELENQGCKAFAMINQIGEETLEAINDLSEDTRKELDGIYLALSQLADKQKQVPQHKKRKPIGFVHYDKEE